MTGEKYSAVAGIITELILERIKKEIEEVKNVKFLAELQVCFFVRSVVLSCIIFFF